MSQRPIPPNYDSAKYKLFGLFSVRSLFESAVITLIGFTLTQQILSVFSNDFAVFTLTAGIFLIAFIALSFLGEEKPISLRLKHLIRFQSGKRKLVYRKIKKRKKLSHPPLLKKEFGLKGSTVPEKAAEEKASKGDTVPPVLRSVSRFSSEMEDVFHAKTSLKKQDYTQEMMPVKNIRGGMIERKDGVFIRILEFSPISFQNQSEERKEQILSAFQSYLLIAPETIQFKIMNLRADLSEYQQNLTAAFRSRKEPEELTNLLKEVLYHSEAAAESSPGEKKFLLILSYVPKETDPEKAFEEAFAALSREAQTAEEYLLRCSNPVIHHVDENAFQLEMLYRYYNRKSSEIIPLQKRITKVFEEKCRAEERSIDPDSEIRMHHLTAPKSADFMRPDVIFSDGQYHLYLGISDYPISESPGFIQFFTSFGEGVECDIHILREEASVMRQKVAMRVSNMEGEIEGMPAQSLAVSKMETVLDYTRACILEPLNQGNPFYYFSVTLCLSAGSLRELEDKKRYVTSRASSYSYRLTPLRYLQEEAYQLCSPASVFSPTVFKEIRRNAAVQSAALLYPFTTAGIKQKEGIHLGFSLENGSPIILDPFHPTSNMAVFGVTGCGKSFLTMLMAVRLRLMQTQVFILSPSKGHEYKKLTEYLGGSYIALGAGSASHINILEIRPLTAVKDLGEIDESDTFEEPSFLEDKVQDLMQFFSLACPNMTARQQDLLNPELILLYNRFGITAENDSIYIGDTKESGRFKSMPILEDLYNQLLQSEDPELRALSDSLKKFVTGNLRCFNHQTNVDLENRFCVMDLTRMQTTEYYQLGLYIAQNYVWRKVRANRTQKKCIIFEEAWLMLETEASALLMKEAYKTSRAYGCVCAALTQSVTDFTERGDVGKAVLDNSLIQMFLHLSSADAGAAKSYFHLTQHEYESIVQAEKGEALICTPQEHYQTKITSTETEKMLFETDRSALERQYRSRKDEEKSA